jgi:hypothetical protein
MPPRLPAGFVPPIPTLPGILYGIELTLFAADTSYFFEIQRATDAIGTGAVTIASGIPGGQKVYVDVVANNISYWYRIRHIYSGATPSPWTCWLGGITGRVMSQEPLALDPVAPILSAVPVRGSSTGTVTVTVTDPQCRVVLVEFETIDNGVSSGWITDSTVPYSAVVNLHAVASNVVNYRVTGYDRDGILRILAQDSFRFDPLGTTAFPPAALITPLNTEVDDTVWNIRFDAILGSGGGGTNLTYDIRQKIGFAAETSLFSGNATSLPKDLSITRHPRSDKEIRHIVTDVLTGLSDVARVTVPSSRPYIDDLARFKRPNPFDDGDYSLRGTTSTGDTAHSGVKESGLKLVNRLFAKPLSSSSDDADAVPNSLTKRVIPFSVIRSSDNFLLSGAENTASLGSRKVADVVNGTATSVWTEVWDTFAPWSIDGGSGTLSLLSDTNATRGKNILVVDGYVALSWPNRIPFDPSKLYRFRWRVRKSANPTGGVSVEYAGLRAQLFDGSDANNNSGANYILEPGTNYSTADGWVVKTTWVKGASIVFTSAGSPSTDPTVPAPINTGVVTFRPYLLINYPVSGTPVGDECVIDYYEITEYDEDGTQRTYTALDVGGANLRGGIGSQNGGSIRNIASGREDVGGMGHGVSRSFPSNFQLPPAVTVAGGISYQPASLWGTTDPIANVHFGSTAPTAGIAQIDESSAVSLTVSGYTTRARLRIPSTSTNRSNAFPAGTITTNGGTLAVTTAQAPAYNDTYTVDVAYSFSATGGHGGLDASSVSATASLQYFNGSVWVTIATASDSDSDVGTSAGGTGSCGVSGTFFLTGPVVLTTTSQLRILLTTNPGSGVRSYSLDPGSATYVTTTGDLYCNKALTSVSGSDVAVPVVNTTIGAT